MIQLKYYGQAEPLEQQGLKSSSHQEANNKRSMKRKGSNSQIICKLVSTIT